MSFKSLWAASIAASRERTNCQYVLLMSSQMYSTKYVVLVRLAVSIVFIVVVFKSPEPAGSVGLVPQPGYKDRYLILITKKKLINFQKFFSGHYENIFGRRVGVRDSRMTIDRPTRYFSRIFVLRHFRPPDGPLVHFTGKCSQIARNGPIRAGTENGRRFATLAVPVPINMNLKT